MVTHVTNDRNESVIAIGAPGSEARARVEWPGLIDELNVLYDTSCDCPGNGWHEAIALLGARGITSRIEKESILRCTIYRRYVEEN